MELLCDSVHQPFVDFIYKAPIQCMAIYNKKKVFETPLFSSNLILKNF